MTPGPGQESVWDYPRPPALAPDSRTVLVRAGRLVVARTSRAIRVLETASPPTFYIPLADVEADLLRPAIGTSWCEWKGKARYWSLQTHLGLAEGVAWSYPDAPGSFAAIRDHVAFYPGRLDCYVDAERVRPQAGGYYGGWITNDVVGPFKGDPGTSGW